MGNSIENARVAKEKAKHLLESVGLKAALGLEKLGDGYGIKVNLTNPAPPQAKLPESVDGVPVRFEVVGEIRKR